MAKKKRKAKGKNRPAGAASAASDADRASAAGGDDAEEDEAEGHADEESDAGESDDDAAAEDGDVAAAKQSRAEKATVRLRGSAKGRPRPPDVDPNIPSPDGPRVSNKGGLIFVMIILALMGLAIAAQFTIGQ